MNDLSVAVFLNQGSIDFGNYDEICSHVQAQMQVYKDLEFSEDRKKEAKSDIATLRKIRKAIDDRRKEVKKQYMAPYDEFDSKVKNLLSIIDEPIALIDSRVKEFEAKRIEEKKLHIKELYEEVIGDMSDMIPLQSIYRPEWENATCADKTIRYDISEKKLKISSDIDAIKMIHTDCEQDAILEYIRKGYDLGAAMLYINQYERIKSKAVESVQASEPVKELPPEESYVTGFATGSKIEALISVICREDEVKGILKLLSDNGYQAERR